jgi:hypothetical protein
MHSGLDFKAFTTCRVTVTAQGYRKVGGYGTLCCSIEPRGGLATGYGYMSRFVVSPAAGCGAAIIGCRLTAFDRGCICITNSIAAGRGTTRCQSNLRSAPNWKARRFGAIQSHNLVACRKAGQTSTRSVFPLGGDHDEPKRAKSTG